MLRASTGIARHPVRGATWKGAAAASRAWSGVPLPFDFFQSSLPTLPLPRLGSTLNAYLSSLAPLVPPAQRERAAAAAAVFATGDGPALQRELEAFTEKAGGGETFVSQLWLQTHLTEHRDGLPLSNPFLALRADTRLPFNNPAARAANIAHAAASFHVALRANALPPDVYATRPELLHTLAPALRFLPHTMRTPAAYAIGAYPLCEAQFTLLFGTTRIPGPHTDFLVPGDATVRHAVLAVGGHLYKIDVVRADGVAESPQIIEAGMRWALADSTKMGPGPNILSLSGLPRVEWYSVREELLRQPDAFTASSCVASALFIVTFDKTANLRPSSLSGPRPDLAAFARTALIGDGGDRAFDKSLSFIVCQDGGAAIHFEHSWGDGIAVVRLANDIVAAVDALPLRPPSTIASASDNSGAAGVVALRLQLSAALAARTIAARAATKFKSNATAIAVHRSAAVTVNRSAFTTRGVSGDAAVQLALQVAHARLHGGAGADGASAGARPLLPPTYESASTAAFRKGRTETVRAATSAAAEAVRLFLEPMPSGGDVAASAVTKATAVAAASSAHKALVLAAVTGKGFDRHLTALRALPGRGVRGAALLDSPAAALWREHRLSTSTLSSPALDGGGFGPVSPSSYGVAYGLDERGFHVLVTAREGAGSEDNSAAAVALRLGFAGKKNAAQLGAMTTEALGEIHQALDMGAGGRGGGKGGRYMA